MTQTYGTRQDEFSYLGPIGQAEIIAINFAEALMMDTARGMAVVTVTASGLVVTRDMLDAEIRAARAPRAVVYSGPLPLVVGLNASANMLA